jgi:hypothetical protein
LFQSGMLHIRHVAHTRRCSCVRLGTLMNARCKVSTTGGGGNLAMTASDFRALAARCNTAARNCSDPFAKEEFRRLLASRSESRRAGSSAQGEQSGFTATRLARLDEAGPRRGSARRLAILSRRLLAGPLGHQVLGSGRQGVLEAPRDSLESFGGRWGRP